MGLVILCGQSANSGSNIGLYVNILMELKYLCLVKTLVVTKVNQDQYSLRGSQVRMHWLE